MNGKLKFEVIGYECILSKATDDYKGKSRISTKHMQCLIFNLVSFFTSILLSLIDNDSIGLNY